MATVGIQELRDELQGGPKSRDDLCRRLHCTRSEVAKPIYTLKQTGEAIEEGDLVMLASQPRKDHQSMDTTTQGEKIDSSPVSGPGMGTPELDPSPSSVTVSGAGCLAPVDGPDLDRKLRAALELLMAELPALLEDREKLRKLKEVLG